MKSFLVSEACEGKSDKFALLNFDFMGEVMINNRIRNTHREKNGIMWEKFPNGYESLTLVVWPLHFLPPLSEASRVTALVSASAAETRALSLLYLCFGQ